MITSRQAADLLNSLNAISKDLGSIKHVITDNTILTLRKALESITTDGTKKFEPVFVHGAGGEGRLNAQAYVAEFAPKLKLMIENNLYQPTNQLTLDVEFFNNKVTEIFTEKKKQKISDSTINLKFQPLQDNRWQFEVTFPDEKIAATFLKDHLGGTNSFSQEYYKKFNMEAYHPNNKWPRQEGNKLIFPAFRGQSGKLLAVFPSSEMTNLFRAKLEPDSIEGDITVPENDKVALFGKIEETNIPLPSFLSPQQQGQIIQQPHEQKVASQTSAQLTQPILLQNKLIAKTGISSFRVEITNVPDDVYFVQQGKLYITYEQKFDPKNVKSTMAGAPSDVNYSNAVLLKTFDIMGANAPLNFQSDALQQRNDGHYSTYRAEITDVNRNFLERINHFEQFYELSKKMATFEETLFQNSNITPNNYQIKVLPSEKTWNAGDLLNIYFNLQDPKVVQPEKGKMAIAKQALMNALKEMNVTYHERVSKSHQVPRDAICINLNPFPPNPGFMDKLNEKCAQHLKILSSPQQVDHKDEKTSLRQPLQTPLEKLFPDYKNKGVRQLVGLLIKSNMQLQGDVFIKINPENGNLKINCTNQNDIQKIMQITQDKALPKEEIINTRQGAQKQFVHEVPLEKGLIFLRQQLGSQYQNELQSKKLGGQDVIEHLLLIGMEEAVIRAGITDQNSVWDKSKAFNTQGEITFKTYDIDQNPVETITGLANLQDLLNNAIPQELFSQIKQIETAKMQAAQSDNSQVDVAAKSSSSMQHNQ